MAQLVKRVFSTESLQFKTQSKITFPYISKYNIYIYNVGKVYINWLLVNNHNIHAHMIYYQMTLEVWMAITQDHQ